MYRIMDNFVCFFERLYSILREDVEEDEENDEGEKKRNNLILETEMYHMNMICRA